MIFLTCEDDGWGKTIYCMSKETEFGWPKVEQQDGAFSIFYFREVSEPSRPVDAN